MQGTPAPQLSYTHLLTPPPPHIYTHPHPHLSAWEEWECEEYRRYGRVWECDDRGED